MLDALAKNDDPSTFVRCGLNPNSNIKPTNAVYFDDNAFLFKQFNEHDTSIEFNKNDTSNEFNNKISLRKIGPDKKTFSNLKYMSANGLRILNIHLPGDGPNGSNMNIEKFVKTYFPSYLPPPETELTENWKPDLTEIPHIIVGDSNITCSKCSKSGITNRDTLLKNFRDAIETLYPVNNFKWALVMNPTLIHKVRVGGFLLNHQIQKSDPNVKAEEDGTFAAFRYDITTDFKLDVYITMQKKFGNYPPPFGEHYEVCLSSSLDIKRSTPVDVKFLDFDTDISTCLNEKTQGYYKVQGTKVPRITYSVIDKLFIDHSIVQINSSLIELLYPTLYSNPIPWSNLVVLNGGSIINAGVKNWTVNETFNSEKMDKIKNIDRELFEKVIASLKNNNTSLPNYTYEQFIVPVVKSLVVNKKIGDAIIQFNNMDDFAIAMIHANQRLKDEVFEPAESQLEESQPAKNQPEESQPAKNQPAKNKSAESKPKPKGISIGGSRKKKKRAQKYTRR